MKDNYYKIPFAFLENEKYKDLTATEMLVYGVLYARYDLSNTNGQFTDEDGVYVIYTVRGLMNYVGISSTATAVKALKNLEEHGLLIRKKGEFGKPDKVYVKEVESKTPKKTTAYDEKIDNLFANLSNYLTETEKRRFEGLLTTLSLKKRDAYKIEKEYIPTERILNRILMLETSDIVEVFRKMREVERNTDIKNYFMYLATALYNAYGG